MDSTKLNNLLLLDSIENLCRICLIEEGSISLLATAVQEDVEINVQEIYEVYANTRILENDNLPQHVCSKCFVDLLKTKDFVTKCQTSNSILQYVKLKFVSEDVKVFETSTVTNDAYECNDVEANYEVPVDCGGTFCQDSKNEKVAVALTLTKLEQSTLKSKGISSETCSSISKVEEKAFKCEKCSMFFTKMCNLRRHCKTHSGTKPYQCSICSKGFTRFGNLKEHENIHTGVKQYHCSTCNKNFHHITTFKTHLMCHTGLSKRYSKVACGVCNRILASKPALYNHMQIHREYFLCNICGMKLSQKASFLHHYRSHTGERPFKCDQCPKAFSYKQGLKAHTLIHTGDKPYKCEHCPKMFTQQNNLKRHIRYHKGSKPYSCMFCEKTFTEKSNLAAHIRIHTGETPHICLICDKGFSEPRSLKKHIKVHNKSLDRANLSKDVA